MKPDRTRSRSFRKWQSLAAVMLVLALILRLWAGVARGQMNWLGAGIIVLILILTILAVILASRKSKLALAQVRSLSELRDRSNRESPFVRQNLVWTEYAIARATIRGECGEREPADYTPEAVMFARQMFAGSRHSTRIQLTLYGFTISVVLAVSLAVFSPDWSAGLIFGFGACLFMLPFFAFGRWTESRRAKQPLAVLGRQIESASDLDGEARWGELLRIAQEHLLLEADALA